MQQIRRNAKDESGVFEACFITSTFILEQWFLNLSVYQNRQQSLLNTYLWSLIQSFCFSRSYVGPRNVHSNKFADASAGPGITFSEEVSLRIIKNKNVSLSAGSAYSLARSQLPDSFLWNSQPKFSISWAIKMSLHPSLWISFFFFPSL